MVGIQLRSNGAAIAASRRLLERGFIVLTGGRRGDVLTLSPPLTIDEDLLAAFVPALAEVLRASG
jgi:4-aminobutyrate aminotransferase/(S)-3-amino-2-methylpropionate transaminase